MDADAPATVRPWLRWAACVALTVAVSALAACDPAPAPARAAVGVDPAFAAAHAAWRATRRDALLAPDGHAGLVGLHPIELKAHYVGADATSGLRLAHGPPKLGLLRQEGGSVTFEPERGVAVTVDGLPAPRGRIPLHDDQAPVQTRLGFDEGRGMLAVVVRGDRRALQVWHADAANRTALQALEAWPVDSTWRLAARFAPHPPGRTLAVTDITGVQSTLRNPGTVTFEYEGGSHALEAVAGNDGVLRLVFADRTSGHGSYGAGRYLDLDTVDADGRVTIDFNRAYNPPCAITRFAPCLLPPDANRLALAVTAGEKAYRATTH